MLSAIMRLKEGVIWKINLLLTIQPGILSESSKDYKKRGRNISFRINIFVRDFWYIAGEKLLYLPVGTI